MSSTALPQRLRGCASWVSGARGARGRRVPSPVEDPRAPTLGSNNKNSPKGTGRGPGQRTPGPESQNGGALGATDFNTGAPNPGPHDARAAPRPERTPRVGIPVCEAPRGRGRAPRAPLPPLPSPTGHVERGRALFPRAWPGGLPETATPDLGKTGGRSGPRPPTPAAFPAWGRGLRA